MEDFTYILDYLPSGHHTPRGNYIRESRAYALGESEFKLLELIPKPEIDLAPGDRVYIGKDKDLREKIMSVKSRISYDDLTTGAKKELPFVLISLVEQNEPKFVRFYNEASPITAKLHSLQLLPGLGRKTMWAIIDARKQGPFSSFVELKDRVAQLHHPAKLIARRIEQELTTEQKYTFFVRSRQPAESRHY